MGQDFGNDDRNVGHVEKFDTCQFKVFEYLCPNCTAKRHLQYFFRNGCFLEQTPVITCGACGVVATRPTRIFKTVDFVCPECHLVRKVRQPAMPIALERYKKSIVTCDRCFFRGEVQVGQYLQAVCGCGRTRGHLANVWAENGSSLVLQCEVCQNQTDQLGVSRNIYETASAQANKTISMFEAGAKTAGRGDADPADHGRSSAQHVRCPGRVASEIQLRISTNGGVSPRSDITSISLSSDPSIADATPRSNESSICEIFPTSTRHA